MEIQCKKFVDLFHTKSVPLEFTHFEPFFDILRLNQNLESPCSALEDWLKPVPRIAGQHLRIVSNQVNLLEALLQLKVQLL